MATVSLTVAAVVLAIGAWTWTRGRSDHPLRLVGHSDWIYSLAFRPDGGVLASGSDDSTIKLWDPASGRFLRSIDATWTSRTIAFSHDGRLLAGSDGRNPMEDRKLRVWDVAANKVVLEVSAPGAEKIGQPAFSPDGRLIAASVRIHGTSSATVWDMSSGSVVRTFPSSGSEVFFTPDGRTLIAAAAGGHDVHVFEWPSGVLLRSFSEAHVIQSVALGPDGQMLAVNTFDYTNADFDRDIQLWNLTTGERVRTMHDSSNVLVTAFSPSGRILASGDADDTVKLWDLASGRVVRTLSGHSSSRPSTCLAFSPDGRKLASGDAGAGILMWNLGSASS